VGHQPCNQIGGIFLIMKKIIEINWDNPTELKKWAAKINARRLKILHDLGYQEIQFVGNKYHAPIILDVINSIMNTDISNVYSNVVGDDMYYVYVHCNPLKPLKVRNDAKHCFLALRFNLTHEPFYVGKGIGSRYVDLNRNDSHRKIRSQILASEQEVMAIRVNENMTENEALAVESKLIDILGLKSYSRHGLLVNLDEGVAAKERRNYYRHSAAKNFLKKNGFNL
jgi:hypothetical protein